MRYKHCAWLVVLVGAAVSCSGPQTGEPAARRALDASAEAMGGWEALRSVRAQRIVSEGSHWEPMQAVAPGETRQINTFSSALTANYQEKSARLELQAQVSYPRESKQQFTEVIQGEAGMLEQADASGTVQRTRLHPSRFATRLRDLNRMPARVLLTASQAEGLTRLADETSPGATHQVLQYKDSGQTVKLRIDSSTHLPASVAYLEDDPVLGDTWNEFVWSDWREAGELTLPYALEQRLNGMTFGKETVREIQNNPSLPPEAFSIPEEVVQAPEAGERIVSHWTLRRTAMGVSYQDYGAPQRATLNAVAPGVWLVGGSGHQTFAIEMRDHLMVVEAPLFEERSRAVIQAIQEKFPAKPIRYTVVTHFHMDHSGGVRAYAAEGATLIAPSGILPFLRTMLASPRTVRPDSLAVLKSKMETSAETALEGVEAMKEYTDGTRVVRLYPIPNPHAKSMLLVYLPKERMTIDADLVSATITANPPVVEPRALAYFDFVKQTGLPVERIGRIHGEVLPFRQTAALAEKAQQSAKEAN